jgi:hypothetical protein
MSEEQIEETLKNGNFPLSFEFFQQIFYFALITQIELDLNGKTGIVSL